MTTTDHDPFCDEDGIDGPFDALAADRCSCCGGTFGDVWGGTREQHAVDCPVATICGTCGGSGGGAAPMSCRVCRGSGEREHPNADRGDYWGAL
jgi:DnaJ-class molecular chaperone